MWKKANSLFLYMLKEFDTENILREIKSQTSCIKNVVE